MKDLLSRSIQSHNIKYFILFFLLSSTLLAQKEDWKSIEGRTFENQSWQQLIDRPDVSFDEVRKAFYKEWENKAFEKHKGVKQFKRMEAEMVGRYEIPYEKRHDFLRKRDKKFRQKNNSTANWSLIGPITPPNGNNEGIGRINDIEFHPTDANTIFASAPSGGIWKSTNGCDSWTNLTGSLENESISDFVIDQNNPDIIYAATSTGIFKTVNGGISWNLSNSGSFRKIVFDPNTSNTVVGMTAISVQKSTDAGATWTEITRTTYSNIFYDLTFMPGSSSTLYISKGGGIDKSTDSGASFSSLILPFSNTDVRDIYMATTPQNANAIFFVAKSSGGSLDGVYKSTDAGTSFSQIVNISDTTGYLSGTNTILFSNFYWFYNDWPIAVNPNDINEITFGNVGLFRTLDGGTTWKTVSSGGGGGSIHVDMMDVKYHPSTHKAYVGCDGGLYKHEIDGQRWKRLNDNLPVTQIYRSSLSNRVSGKYLIGNQDNGVMKMESNFWVHEVIGDGMDSYQFQSDPNIMITSTQYGNFRISTNNGSSWSTLFTRSIAGELSQWTAPIYVNSLNENDILIGYQNLWRSIDRGATWNKIEVAGTSSYTINRIARSQYNSNLIAIIKRNEVIISSDAGATWSVSSLPSASGLQDIKYSYQSNTLYLLYFDKIYRSPDNGVTWEDYSSGLPSGGDSYRTLAVFNNTTEEYYIGGFGSVYHKSGDNDWTNYSTNLPGTSVTDLDIDYTSSEIVASTYGRGLWKSPLANTSSRACFDYNIPTITPSGSIDLCNASSTTLTASTAPSGTFIWYKDGAILYGLNTQSIQVTETGIYNARYAITNCDSYSSEVVSVRLGCAYQSCTDFNPSSSGGPGNQTIISLAAPTQSPEQSATTLSFCFTTEGDINWSGQEVFNILDESSNLLGTTNNGGDCGGPSIPKCFDISIADYNAWISDGFITFSLDPVSTNINPTYCSTNEACVELFFNTDPPGSNCTNTWDLTGPVSGTYGDSYNISIQNASINSTSTGSFSAENCIEIMGPFDVNANAVMDISITPCTN